MKRYIIRQRPSPRIELRVDDAQGKQVFCIMRRPTHPPSYTLIPTGGEDRTPLTVKTMKLPPIKRYTLTQGDTLLLTLQPIPARGVYSLRNGQRLLGRFIPVNSILTFLRTPTYITARIRLLPTPPPTIHATCDIAPQRQWLLATLLYLIALIDEAIREP